jgi:hypothetical protein
MQRAKYKRCARKGTGQKRTGARINSLDELELASHVLPFQTVAQKMQGPDDLANRADALLGVHNPSMFIAGRMMT